MAEWITTNLEECTDVLGDGLHGTPKYTERGEYAFINGNNLVDGEILIKKETKRVDYSQYEKYKKPLTDRTILVSINGTLGNVGIYDSEKIILGKSACFFNVKESVDKDFIYYIVSSPAFKQYLESNATGTTIKNISLKQMRKYTFSLPQISEQKRISSVLRRIDEKIKNNRAINKNLFEQMQALYKDWFVNFEPFGGVRPSGWNNTNIYAIANIIYGAPFASKLFNTDGLGKPIIRIRDLKEQTFVTFTTEEHPKGHLIQPGDIVVGMDGEFRPYIWGNEPAWLNQRVCIFESNRPRGKAFVLYTIKPLLNKIEQTQVATTVIHIGKKDFDAFEIVLPDEATLDSFDSITAPMVEKIVNNSLQNKRLAVLRDTLLPKLMSGELDVSNVEI